MTSSTETPATQIAPRPLFRSPPPGGRRHVRRYSRCSAVVKDTANATVSSTPIRPVAALVASGEAKAWLTACRDWPSIPSRSASACRISRLTRSGVTALITISSGNNETNALAASATDRSTNSISNSRDHHRPMTVLSSRSAVRAAYRRARATLLWAPVPDSTVTDGCYVDPGPASGRSGRDAEVTRGRQSAGGRCWVFGGGALAFVGSRTGPTV